MRKKISVDYLTYIDDPLEGGADKLGILKYLNKSENSLSILEVGPGAGKTLEKAINISKIKNYPDKYYVIDNDPLILDNLKKHLDLSKYNKINYLHEDILEASFPDNFFDIINLSSVIHECATYQGGWQAIERLVESTSQVVNRNGILLLRELECENFHTIVKCKLVGAPVNIFFRIFFKKFMDHEYCSFRKPTYYNIQSVQLYLKKKKYSIHDFFSHHQNFAINDSVTLEAPIGLIREVQRHFLTFLNVYSPELFYSIQEMDGQYLLLEFKKNNALHKFITCCKQINIDYCINRSFIRIKQKDLFLIKKHIMTKFLQLTRLYHFTIPKNNIQNLKNILFNMNCSFIEKEGRFELSLENILWLDNLLVSMNYQSDVNQLILDWSRREGDEYYFFGNWSEIIKLYIKKSLPKNYDMLSPSERYCLVPIEMSFVPRSQYIDILKTFFKEYESEYGYVEQEGKKIVHFQKLPMQIALPKIIDFFDHHYGKLDDSLLKQLYECNRQTQKRL